MAERGRPSLYTEELAALICERISGGESLRAICRDAEMPSLSTVMGWLESEGKQEFRSKYARAREILAENGAQELVALADEKPPTLPSGAVDSGWVKWQANRIATRQWNATKLLAKKYGDKLAVGGADDLPPIQTTDSREIARKLAFLLQKGAQEK